MKIISKIYKNEIATASAIGLQKSTNEDVIGFKATDTGAIICLCDGHWGDFTAKFVKSKILSKPFPKSKKEAVRDLKKIEHQLWEKFGTENMDQNKDLTPETSLVAIEKIENTISIVSYGDCRMIICRKGQQIFKLKTTSTWLGAFSFLKLRNRIPIEKALIFKKIICQPEDVVMLFSDGIDECKYEKMTISFKWLADQTKGNLNLKKIIQNIFDMIEQNGAEDNASLAMLRF